MWAPNGAEIGIEPGKLRGASKAPCHGQAAGRALERRQTGHVIGRGIGCRGLRLIRVALYLLSLGFVLSAGLVAVLTEAEPSLPPTQAPDAQDVRRVRAAVQEIRAVTDGRAAVPELAMEVGTLAGVIRLGARFLPGLRAEARIEDGAVQGRAALPVPGFGGRWLNVAATVPPFEGGFAPAAVSVGRVTLPPGPSVALARRLANLLIGDRAGDTIIGSAEAMRIEG